MRGRRVHVRGGCLDEPEALLPWPGAISRRACVMPAGLYFWPAPHTYTGQELVELHTLSSPPLVDLLVAQLLDAARGLPNLENSPSARSWLGSSI